MTDKKYLTKENLLITSKDCSNIFDGFKNDKERIKYMSHAYRNMNIAKAFGVFYGFDVDNDVKHNKNVNSVYSIEIGQVYSANVKQFDKNTLTFDIPGVKEEIVAKDNECSILRKEDETKAYFGCHTDITIPYDELGEITAITKSGEEITIIRNGKFVLSGCEELNQPLEKIKING